MRGTFGLIPRPPARKPRTLFSVVVFRPFASKDPNTFIPNATYTVQIEPHNPIRKRSSHKGSCVVVFSIRTGVLERIQLYGQPWATAGLLQNAIWAFMGQEGLNIDLTTRSKLRLAAAIGLAQSKTRLQLGNTVFTSSTSGTTVRVAEIQPRTN